VTLERAVKKSVSSLLSQYFGLFYAMPVPNGMGQPNLDYNGCYYGLFFAIETKRPGGKLTLQQEATARRIRAAGGKVFIIDGDLSELETWLNLVTACKGMLANPPSPSTSAWGNG
jgi:hypothetical protein